MEFKFGVTEVRQLDDSFLTQIFQIQPLRTRTSAGYDPDEGRKVLKKTQRPARIQCCIDALKPLRSLYLPYRQKYLQRTCYSTLSRIFFKIFTHTRIR